MSRDNHFQRSRSRSISRFRSNNSKSQRTPPQFSSSSSYRYNSRNDSPPPKRSRYQRERSRSFEKNGRAHRRNSPATTDISRKNHQPSKVLGVFNLHVRTTEDEIRDVFERFGVIDEIVMVKDAKTRGFRGYCFLYFNKQRDATTALDQCNGIEIKDRQIRVDYSLSEGPHVSTPGEYRGKRGAATSMRGPRPRHSSPMRGGDRTRYYESRYEGGRGRSRDRYESDHRRRTPPRSFERSDYRERRGSPERFERYARRTPVRERRH